MIIAQAYVKSIGSLFALLVFGTDMSARRCACMNLLAFTFHGSLESTSFHLQMHFLPAVYL